MVLASAGVLAEQLLNAFSKCWEGGISQDCSQCYRGLLLEVYEFGLEVIILVAFSVDDYNF